MSLYTKIEDLQKLHAAWERVRKNKPACGVDNVSWQMFDNNCKAEIKQLNIELRNHNYKTLPVKLMKLYKEEKIREIALFSMRDKVVHQSVATELNSIYDKIFSSCVYAYRPNRSALQAIERIEDMVQEGTYTSVMKLDISNFFDTINHDILKNILHKRIKEEDVIDLIIRTVTVESVSEGGELAKKEWVFIRVHQLPQYCQMFTLWILTICWSRRMFFISDILMIF